MVREERQSAALRLRSGGGDCRQSGAARLNDEVYLHYIMKPLDDKPEAPAKPTPATSPLRPRTTR